MKICKACGLEKPPTDFLINKRLRSGLSTYCRICHNAMGREWRKNNPDKARAVDAAKYRSRKEEHAKLTAEWRAKHPGYGTERYAVRKADPEFLASRVAAVLKYKAAKLDRMPEWVVNDPDMVWMIEEAYHLAKLREEVMGGKWHVDHAVPLRGKKVSGLHVPWNLRVIPAKENIRKSNKFEPE